MSAPSAQRTALRLQVRQCHIDLDEAAATALHKRHGPKSWSPAVRLYLHALCVEDITIQSVLRERAPLFSSFWPNLEGPTDVTALRHYARAVYAATDAYLAELPSDGLSRLVDLRKLRSGRRTVAW